MSEIKIVQVQSKKELASFIDFPHELYKNDANYVPELFIAQKDLLTTHPFHKHNQLQCFFALKGGAITGRIAAIFNVSSNEFNNATDGFFGFFDCVNDLETARALFATASDWLKAKGATNMIGPVNFSTNETCGMLLEGFDSAPVVMMTYNAPYYNTLMDKLGFEKRVDLFAFQFKAGTYDDKSARMTAILQERLKRSGIVIRKVNLKKFKEEAAKLRETYNKAWDNNMGFVPMNDAEFQYLANDLKLVLDPDFCILAEKDNKIVGFGLAVPDVNQIQIKIKKGRLLPTGIFKLLFGKKSITGIRIMALGVIDGYRKLGIEACLYGTMIQEFERKKLLTAEASWTLEHNDLINRAIMAIKGVLYKKYRIYQKTI